MTDYSDWKVLKSVLDYSGDDEEKQAAQQAAQAQYEQAANWCDDNQDYCMGEDGKYYAVISNEKPEPTKEQIRKMREFAYSEEVDTKTSHISRLRDTTPMTPEIEAEIAKLIAERDAKYAEIQERYPYPDEADDEVA